MYPESTRRSARGADEDPPWAVVDRVVRMVDENTDFPQVLRWEQAAKTAAALAPAGPKLSSRQVGAAVESIRYHALASVDHVYRITGLEAARNLHDSEVLVVDRAGWSRANAQTFSVLLGGVMSGGINQRLEQMSGLERRVTQTGAEVELGAVLAFLSAKVLGQYDPLGRLGGFGPSGGRLMLVAPNIVAMERELNLESDDFRLWVCLHEQTHRVQFAAAPWLSEHLTGLMGQLPERLGGGSEMLRRLLEGLRESAGGVLSSAQQQGEPRSGAAHRFTALMDPQAREIFSRLTAVMSLMEGHANLVMDAVDASVVPSVKTIRRRFEQRGGQRGVVETVMRKVLGLDLKMRQYRDGQRFAEHIVAARGMEAFNRIWEGPEQLPSEEEIHEPDQWISRVLDGRLLEGSREEGGES